MSPSSLCGPHDRCPSASHALPLPALMVGGTSSNAGKTLSTLALLCALHKRGLRVHTAKTGPDYIDTAFHAGLTRAPAANLDCWMAAVPDCAEERPQDAPHDRKNSTPALAPLHALVQRMLAPDSQGSPDLVVVEGAMGLYDGGAGGAACTAQLAALLHLPVLLLLNTQGLGQSVAALAEGFLGHKALWADACGLPAFAGLLCTHVGGPRHQEILREALAPVCESYNLPLVGLLPRANAPLLPSRHLGLVQAEETLPAVDTAALAAWFEDNTALDSLLTRLGAPLHGQAASASTSAPASASASALAHRERGAPAESLGQHFFPPLYMPAQVAGAGKQLRVAMAWDAAFRFCYADLPALWQEAGAAVCFFSPLRDPAPPACDGVYFPGGYPELYAQALSENTAMRRALHALAADGLPMYGECGGYMYLMRSLECHGKTYALSGLLPLDALVGPERAALGYREATAVAQWPLGAKACAHATVGIKAVPPESSVFESPVSNSPVSDRAVTDSSVLVRGHEFHYGRITQSTLPQGCTPLWHVRDSAGRPLGTEGCRCGSVAGSWLHVYPAGARRFWHCWLQSLREAR